MSLNTNGLQINKTLSKSSNRFPVVGVGASAGGLEAFKELIKAIPEDSGMAYVLVQHLDPHHDSLLAELLQKVTKIPVLEISNDIRVNPNHIYIIPSNKMLIANDGVLELSPRPEKSRTTVNLPIDLFFTSLAEVHQSHAVGVVLSGTASDGTLGLKAIKDRGGITFAQDGASAAYDGMPHSAVQAGVVDYILPPGEIPRKLSEVVNQVTRAATEPDNIPVQQEEAFRQMLTLLLLRKGTDFTYYRQTTLRRRILRRMAINKMPGHLDYLRYLQVNTTEQDILYLDLLIPVTGFFRDRKVFDNLSKHIFPELLTNKTINEPLRIWVAGCSTGEEVYSMAVCIRQLLSSRLSLNPDQPIQLFATDISEPAIAKARLGVYSKLEVKGLSDQQLASFFTETDGSYQANKSIRDMCVFAVHNFLKDPPFSKIDFISCRNVLIYMEPYLQKKALKTFHYALNTRAFLLLGKSETTAVVPDLFISINSKDKLFARKNVGGHQVPKLSPRNAEIDAGVKPKASIEKGDDFQKIADNILLRTYTPAGVVVNESMDIVHFRGSIGRYLEPSPGKASLNLLKMAREGLAFELRNIIHKSRKDNRIIVKEGIPLITSGGQTKISIEVIPLPNLVEPYNLVLFREMVETKPPIRPDSLFPPGNDEKDFRIKQLEFELAQLREDMRSITEEQDTVNQELQNANEELLSSSEELQSVNEEMETSKEELQSTNEELTVVNQEILGLNEQVTAARDYSEAIVATIHEPLLVLNKNLRIKSANDAFYSTFKVSERETEGHLIYELGNKQWNIPVLKQVLENILPNNSSLNSFEVTRTFPHIGERTMLLNAREMTRSKEGEKLILLAIADVTEKNRYYAKEKELLSRFQHLVDVAPVAILVLKGADFIVELANDFYLEIVEQGESFIGRRFFDALPELRNQGMYEYLDGVMKTGEPFYGNEMEFQILRGKKKVKCFFNFVYQPIRENDRMVSGIIVVVTEVTEQVVARKKMEAQALMVEDLLLTAPAFICTLTGAEHVYELINERYQELFGVRILRGKPILEALPELKGQGFDTLLDQVYQTGKPYVGFDIPIKLARVDGDTPELMYFNFSYQPIYNEERKISGILVFGYDVTEKANYHRKIKESETHFRQMADLMPAKVSNANVNGDVTYFNEKWLEFSGMSFDELKDFGYHKIMHPDELTEFQRRLEESAALGTVTEMEMRFLNKAGNYIWHSNLASPVKDENGRINMWIGVTTDITEQVNIRNNNLKTYEMHSKELEEMVKKRTSELSDSNDLLKDKNEELEKMNRELESFTYVSSHDLQEPLRKIQTFAGILLAKETKNLTDKGKDYFTRMRDAAERMQQLISDLLSFSRINMADRHFEKINLGLIIDKIQSSFKEDIQEKNATIEAGGSCEFNIISFQFEQLFQNLISNALKFSKPGVSPHIVIRWEKNLGSDLNNARLLPDKYYCHICFTDNGIGFDAKYREQIFDVFQRLHGREEYPGTGIGLSIVKKIVENHHGVVIASGETGKGARFDIFVPA